MNQNRFSLGIGNFLQNAIRPHGLVASLANDLGRPLLVRDGAVQFRDEPTETWFRERFRPTLVSLGDFVERLLPLASSSAYVAATLPQLMLEAKQFDVLVRLSLAGDALPEGDAVARRDVELQRLRFALQAALRDRRYEAAAKLSLKAGGEVAAGDRQQQLISANTDLGAHFLGSERMAEHVSRRQISGGGWTGSKHAYEAAFLSGAAGLAGDARSRLRIAYGWLDHWGRSPEARGGERVEIADIVELAWAELNLHGAPKSAWQLRRWKPRDTSYTAGRILVSRLIDAGRFDDVDALALAAKNDIGLLLAIGLELSAVGRCPTKAVAQRTVKLLASRHLKLKAPQEWHGGETLIAAVTAMVALAAIGKLVRRRELARIMRRYLPTVVPRSLGGQHANLYGARTDIIRAYALLSALRGGVLKLEQLATPEMRKALARKNNHDGDAAYFRMEVGALLPWARLWADVTLGRVGAASAPQRIAATAIESAKAEAQSYRDSSATANEVAAWWSEIILITKTGADGWAGFDAWRVALRQPLSTHTLVAIARRVARVAGKGGRALDLAREAFELAAREREDAEQKTETLIQLARAVLQVSVPEARAYFEEAVVASGKIGAENLARWQAILHLGDASARSRGDDPEAAYRFSRAAELTYDFVARDKHFPWGHTAETLADLSAFSVFPILSRWFDRRFGQEERLLPIVVERLLARSQMDARTALALLPIRSWWEPHRLLAQALGAEPDANRRLIAAQHVVRSQRFSTNLDQLRKIEQLLQVNGIDLPEARAAVRRAELAKANRISDKEQFCSPPRETACDWDSIFQGLSLTSGKDLLTANSRFLSGERPHWGEEFNRQVCSRVGSGDEAAFLDAVRETRSLKLYNVNALLMALPTAWSQRLSVRPALQRLLRAVCRQDSAKVSADRNYELLRWALALDLSGLTARELMEEAIVGIADTEVPNDAEGLFRLVGILSHQLENGEAKAALCYGLELLELSLEPTDGDGAWSPALEPPNGVEAALAGYIWVALGSPSAERRWEAAHSVRAICLLRRDSVLKALVDHAETGAAGAFADSKLKFYDQTALLWLLIALARAARESGSVVAKHLNFLWCHARRNHLHILQRGFAARALLSLAQQGLVELDDCQAGELRTINASRLPPLTQKRGTYERRGSHRPYDETRFSFGIDIGPYWLEPLGRVFGLDQQRIEDEAEKVIREDWGLSESGRWDQDERGIRRYFNDSSSRHSHGSTPKIENLQFYLSFHALMTVAGKLLETEPALPESNDSWSSFPEWLRGQDLSRRDGLWLADRREPTPADVLAMPLLSDTDWPKSAIADEAYRLITLPEKQIVVSGYWSSYAGKCAQVVSVSSALASRDRSEALVRALRTANDPYDFKVPAFEDSLEIDKQPYIFKGWVRDGAEERGLDEYDPWAANINARILAPAEPFAHGLSLRADRAGSCWLDQANVPQMWSQTWSEGDDDGEDIRNGNGRRLIATLDSVDAIMRLAGLDLIVEVTLERKLTKSRYERDREREVGRKISEIVLFRPGREPWRIPINPQTRTGSRRRTRTR